MPLAGVAQATVLYSTSFESPSFNLGPLTPGDFSNPQGQDGFRFPISADGEFVISNERAASGTQSARLNGTINDLREDAFKPLSYNPATAAEKTIIGQVDFLYNEPQSGQVSAMFGMSLVGRASSSLFAPAVQFGVRHGDALGTSRFFFRGSIPQNGAPGDASALNGTLPFELQSETWYTLRLVADYPTQTARAYVGLRGSDLVEVGSPRVFHLFSFSSFDSVSFWQDNLPGTVSGVSTAVSTMGYFDNYSVQAVPEPGTMAALALGAAALVRRRAKK